MPVIWGDPDPASVEHWKEITSRPGFGYASENIKPQPLAYELVPILQDRITELLKEVQRLKGEP